MRSFEPKRPHLFALALLSVWVLVLALPMLQGQWLAGPWSDQYAAGYAYRAWGAEQWRQLGHPPLWNPMIFGGLPFIAAGHGDIFYPTSFLRLILPVATVINLGFLMHYVAAGLLTYAWLRKLGVSWGGGLAGALAYQLSGLMASYPSPGHDGKLFASTALPLGLLALVLAMRERRWVGYPLLAIAVALAILGHFQMAYYFCVAIGIFALYLAYSERRVGEPLAPTVGRLGIALAAVLIGFGLTAIQIVPFFAYIPFSPRAETYYGYQGAITWAIPWEHVPEFFLANFVGSRESYWGSNFGKLHSEYLGLPVIALAVLGAMDRSRRRFAWWFGGIGLLFLLVSLGGSTPFYRVWWEVAPLMKKVRGAGMAFFIPSFVVATFAGFGVERLGRREGQRHAQVWLGVAGLIAVLAGAGVLASVAQSVATGVETELRRAAVAAARGGESAVTVGALGSATALALTGGLALAWLRHRLKAAPFVLLMALVLSADLWRNATGFWTYSRADKELFRLDPVTEHLTRARLPYRVLDFGVYPGDGVALMAFGIPQLLGHHGNELHRFDELLGGKNQWRYVLSPRVRDLFAVNYVVLPSGAGIAQQIPGFRDVYDPLMTGVPTSAGVAADLFVRRDPAPYARLVPLAVKAPDDRAIPTIVDPRTAFDPDRVVIVPPDAPVPDETVQRLPGPLQVSVQVTSWAPGRMTVRVEPPTPGDAYLVLSENWYPDWRATIDGVPAATMRGNVSLVTVPVPAGAETVELVFESAHYLTGKHLTAVSLGLVFLGLVVPPVLRRRQRG